MMKWKVNWKERPPTVTCSLCMSPAIFRGQNLRVLKNMGDAKIFPSIILWASKRCWLVLNTLIKDVCTSLYFFDARKPTDASRIGRGGEKPSVVHMSHHRFFHVKKCNFLIVRWDAFSIVPFIKYFYMKITSLQTVNIKN